MKKTLIIVCGDRERKYATYIQQLISAFDDTETERVGTPDGMIDAVIWDEKHYRDNLEKLNVSNHILFIGDSNIAKEARSNMITKYSELGMTYGWLGTQAFMRVEDGSLNKDNYIKFKELCQSYGKSFERELNLRYGSSENEPKESSSQDLEDHQNPETQKKDDESSMPKIFSLILGAANVAFDQGKTLVDNVMKTIDKGSDLFQADEARDQQYSLLSLIVYKKALPEFLEDKA